MELNALKTTVILNPRQLYWSKLMQKRKKLSLLMWMSPSRICKVFTGKDTVSVFNSVLIG